MTVNGFDDRYFYPNLHELLRPAKAITDAKHLHGRRQSLKDTIGAVRTPGRQVFIYGERGVGKTSLAKTAANIFCPEANILIGCEKDSNFSSIINDIIDRILPFCSKKPNKKELYAGINIFGIKISSSSTWERSEKKESLSINDSILVLKAISSGLEFNPCVIIDEFDVIVNEDEKGKFAEFLKQVSDQDLEMKFIFCGISKDVDSLIGRHFSAGRYIEPVELGQLNPGDLFNIIEDAFKFFRLGIGKEYLVRSSLISDGYPYFMHLIGENLLISMHDDDKVVSSVSDYHFQSAIDRAVEKAEPMLKSAYDEATKKYLDDYQEVLWSVASMKVFENKWQDIYDRGYRLVMSKRSGRQELDKDTFYKRLLKLTHEECGKILSTNKNGWYQFSENVVRSYVRLRAVENGVPLGVDLPGPESHR